MPGCLDGCAIWWSDRAPEPFGEQQALAGKLITEQQFKELIYLQRMGW